MALPTLPFCLSLSPTLSPCLFLSPIFLYVPVIPSPPSLYASSMTQHPPIFQLITLSSSSFSCFPSPAVTLAFPSWLLCSLNKTLLYWIFVKNVVDTIRAFAQLLKCFFFPNYKSRLLFLSIIIVLLLSHPIVPFLTGVACGNWQWSRVEQVRISWTRMWSAAWKTAWPPRPMRGESVGWSKRK